ncbi:c-type cytochrome [Thalassolituus sp. LLYu03]|uniref:c-type cytochrome n=1 Tax=Thalassolituus sp. LLYu03 TaxID=3421656 RepID=UPI003D2BC85D
MKPISWLAVLMCCTALFSGCNSDYSGNVGGASNGGDGTLYGNFNAEGQRQYNAQCASCHGIDGNGSPDGSSLVACSTCTSVSVLADVIARTMPIANTDNCSGSCASDTAEYILYAFNGSNLSAAATSIDGVANSELIVTLRSAALQLAGRLPTAAEENMVSQNGENGLSTALNQIMNEEAFYERLMEMFNEQLLTDKYLTLNQYEGGINLLDPEDFPNRKWYNTTYAADEQSNIRGCVRTLTNDAVAREPLELVRYAAKNNLPHTLYVNADYMMVNWYSQQVYEAELVDPSVPFRQLSEPVCDADGVQIAYDPTDFRPARVTKDLEFEQGGMPHAGVLSSPMFLNRYPTTFTNRNRHRSRIVFDYFLDTDILKIEGERPGDGIGTGVANPTLLDPACYACHQVMDPVSSAFQHYTDRGQYITTGSTSRNSWDSSDIEPAGLAGKTIPLSGSTGYFRNMIQWLGKEIGADPRFMRATVRTLYVGLIGQEPLETPGEDATDAVKQAFTAQRAILNSIGQTMVTNNWNIKTGVKGIVLSPYYRAKTLDAGKVVANEHIGATQFLSPEQMQRKLQATVGFGWDEFRSENNRIMYGGMDSDSIIERIREPSGLTIAIQMRMATEMACRSTALDFTRDDSERKLFPYVTVLTEPTNADGEEDANGVARIKHNIQHLHWVLLGERVDLNGEEVTATYNLFTSLLAQGQDMLANRNSYDPRPGDYLEWDCRARWYRQADGRTDGDLPAESMLEADSNYTIRAWTGVLTYLMSDYRFAYE